MKLNNYISFLLCCLLSMGLFNMANGQVVIFEEQFDGEIPADWTNEGTQTLPDGTVTMGFPWTWNADSNFDGIGNPTAAMNISSPSLSNGVAVLNADFYTTMGTTNPGPSPYPQYESDLISPNIDCSGFANVSVAFYQAFAGLNGDDAFPQITEVGALFMYSIDGGNTWVDTIAVNDDLSPNDVTPAGDQKVYDLVGAGGSSEVVLRFSFDGDFYAWAIDDVQVIEKPDNDLVINTDAVFYPASSVQQPEVSIAGDTMGFFVGVINNGAADAFDIIVKASIFKGNNLIWADSTLIPTLAAGVTDSVFALDNVFVPEIDQGTYFVQYDVYQQNEDDFTPSNNTWRQIFRVTDDLFSKDDGDDNFFSGLRASGEATNGSYIFGNNYFISSSVIDEYRLDRVKFACRPPDGEELAGHEVDIYFAKVLGEPFDDDFDLAEGGNSSVSGIGSSSLEILGFGEHEFTNEGSGQIVNKELENNVGSSDDPIILEPNTHYFVMVDYDEDNWDVFTQITDKFIFSTVNFILYSYSEADGGYQWFTGIQGLEVAPTIRFDIALENVVDVEETTLPESTFQIFPNPTSDFINAQLQFDQPTDVNITLADITGKVIKLDIKEGITSQNVQYDLSNYENGTYIIRLATREGTKTYKFVVQK